MLLYGAGDAGHLALREIRQNPDLQLDPVGFVDDDRTKHRAMVHGLPVLGGGDDLSELISRYDIEEVIITIRVEDHLQDTSPLAHCHSCGIDYRQLKIGFM